jgi:hypothetical protein
MEATAQAELFREFPVTAAKTPRRGFLWRYLELTMDHGALVPLRYVDEALGVSRQRVHQLTSAGRLPVVEIDDRKFVPAAALELFLTEDRKSGVHLSRQWIFLGDGQPVQK